MEVAELCLIDHADLDEEVPLPHNIPLQIPRSHPSNQPSATCPLPTFSPHKIFSTHPLPPPPSSHAQAEYPANPSSKKNAIFYSTPFRIDHLNLLPPKRTSLRQSRFPARRLAQHGAAAAADDDGLGVREDGGDGEAAGAFDVHEEGAGDGDEGLGLEGRGVSDVGGGFWKGFGVDGGW